MEAKFTPENLSQRLVYFSNFLRQNQLHTTPSSTIDAQQVFCLGYLDQPSLIRGALKTCYCHNQSDWEKFDALFDTFWLSTPETSTNPDELNPGSQTPEQLSVTQSSENRLVGFAGVSSEEAEDNLSGAGDFKALSLSDFRFVFDPHQKVAIEKLVDALARRSRRQYFRKVKIRYKGERIAMNHALRKSLKTRGQVIKFQYKKRQKRLPKFILLLDVSQSMDVYAKIFLRYARQIMATFERSEAFAFNTHLMPLGTGFTTLKESDMERRLNEQSNSWLGGTRIAASFAHFNKEHLKQCVNNRTTVLIFSDGCDTDSTEELIPELAHIQRRAKSLVWVNPLLGRFKENEANKDMDPLQPYIDIYRSAHNLDSLQLLEKDLLGK